MNARFHIASAVGIGAMALAAAGLAGCRSSAEPPSTRATAQTSPATTAPPPVVEVAAAAPTVPPAQPVAPPKQASPPPPPPPPPPKKGVTREQCRRAFTATCSARCRAKDRGQLDNTIKGRRIEADLCFADCARSAEAGCP